MKEKVVEQLGPTWAKALSEELEKDYVKTLQEFVRQERTAHKVYPTPENTFSAFRLTPFDQVKVVILGQDPYHGYGQAHGLAFSVLDGIKTPPSLRNIFQELNSDIGCMTPSSGNLTKWAQNGVLLLNTTLTVREGSPASHSSKGWEGITDAAVIKLSQEREGIVFMLWGKHAQGKAPLIDFKRHLILKAPHPSPFSAHKGFFGCKHFSQANEYLKEPIDWSL